ncbi:hypothetical protein SAMN05216370_3723 [Pseudomonas peli]|uniref:Uncharacterized protein n=1 Tax=Pseudomonas peli TaxID=592361 RepID=A0AB37ZBT1_9PSED|nr:hypothetical protein [Pseudomonas peli]NMZ70970.1 hypothetical protein [Pseudomonas peli]SCW81908.1 hypothetical protein SAMN05216370_3723 [Pseudomonas peli]
MTKISMQPLSLSTLAGASALAFAISSAAPVAATQKAEEPRAVKFSYTQASPSNESLQIIFSQSATGSFEDRISSVYSNLSSSQTELGVEYEALLLNNLSSLYED